uniref:Dynein heavy chain n=1 Tax=Leptobrachium leishanense TaxID=445787 RepID=A0A8C5WK28_9ANUR
MDELLKWLEVRISSSLRPRTDDLKTLLQQHNYRVCLSEFLKNEDVHALYVYFKQAKTTLAASISPPDSLQNKCICFIKLATASKLTLENIDNSVICMDCAKFPLQYIDLVLHQVYLPLLCNDSVMAGTPCNSDRIIDILHRFTGNLEIIAGQVEGSIVLPMPSLELLKNSSFTSKHGAVIHIMETTVIGWIRQIKVVLKHDPLAELKNKAPKPGVYDEQDMWRIYIQSLQFISRQLNSAEAKDLISHLEEAKSTYGHSIIVISQDVTKALSQAEENLTFLKTLIQWFDKMKLTTSSEKQKYFLQMIHNLFLVWKHSRHYHENKVFLNLLKLLSNEVVEIASSLVGPNLLDAPQAYSRLKDALKLCATFRGTYLDIKVTADVFNIKKKEENNMQMSKKNPGAVWNLTMYEPPQPKFSRKDWYSTNQSKEKDNTEELWIDSPWPPHNAHCFQTMNLFMERCNDVLDLVETMKHFQTLKMVACIGGAGSSSLDAMVQEIWDSYCIAKETFVKQITDIFATDKNSPFERAFFYFRTTIKTLEHKLGGILRRSFDQCPTIAAQLRLLEVFEGISRRDVVKEHLKDKDEELVVMFMEELTRVNEIYVAMADNPPMHVNMTPTTSKLLWIKGLHARISEPMSKLKSVSSLSLDGDLGWKLRHLYKETEEELERFEDNVVKSWLSSMDKELGDSLKLPLLRTSGMKNDHEDYLCEIELNLNPELLNFLREAEYLVGPPFKIQLPESLETLRKNMDIDKFKVLLKRLETVVSKYKEVVKSISYHHRALFQKKLLKTSEILKDGTSLFTWSMEESADYTERATAYICADLHSNFSIVTNNYKIITELAAAWCTANLDVFTCRDFSRISSITELIVTQRNIEHEVESMLVPDGQRIHSLVQESFRASGISEASPAWQDFIMDIDDIIFQGLKKVTISSLAALLNTILDCEQVPILCIDIELINNEVVFNPPLDQRMSDTSVKENIEEWLKVFLLRGSHIQAISPAVKGGYALYLSEDEEVLQLIGHILQQAEQSFNDCQVLLEDFGNYSFLWKQDVNAEFQDFLDGKQPNPLSMKQGGKDENDAASNRNNSMKTPSNPLFEAERSFLLPTDHVDQKTFCPLLEDFDMEISTYKSARDKIQKMPDLQRSGWIQVDFRPIKQVLRAYSLKWMWTFTKYLIDQTSTILRNLDSFLRRTEPQIESISGDARDTGSFMKMMRLFNEVSAKQVEMDVQFIMLQKTVTLTGKYGMELPADVEVLFKTMPARWNNMKTKVSLAKQRLGPRIHLEADRVTKDLERFQHKLDILGQDIENSEVYMFKCTSPEAFKIIAHFNSEVQILQNEAKDLNELQDLMETTVVDFSILTSCEELLHKLSIVWQQVDLILKEQETWKTVVWQNMDTALLYLRTNYHLECLQSLSQEMQEWDVYKNTLEAVNTMHLTLPLIEEISNPAMRTRHWNQLVRQTGGLLHVTAQSLKSLTLGDLLAMGLEKHSGDVKVAVQRAVRDVTIESSLKNCEEVWLSRIFDLRPHSRVIISKAHNEDLASSISGSHHTKGDVSRNVTTRGGSRRPSKQSDRGYPLSRKGGKGSSISLYESLKNIEEPGTVVLLKATDSVFEELEHHQIVLTGIQPHAESGSFLDEVTKWQKRLKVIETTVHLWLLVQEKWTQLEEVFSTLAFRVAVPREAALFADVHHHFCRLMKSVEENPNILQNCMRRGLESLLEMLNYKLERCQRAVSLHLEQKRLAFPRLFFLSLEDTLNIVCYGYDLDILSTYLGKIFHCVHSLVFDTTEPGSENEVCKILGVRSFFGEELYLVEPLECGGPVENWLPQLVNSVKASLQHHLWATLEHRDVVPTRRKEIHSAGARRVVINKPASKEESATTTRPREEEGCQSKPESRHWVLNVPSDVAYLSTQIKFSKDFKDNFGLGYEHSTEGIQGCLKDLTEGIEYAAKILNEIPQEDITQPSKRTSKAERGGNEQGEEVFTGSICGNDWNQETCKPSLSAGNVIKLTNHILLLIYQRDITAKLLSEASPVWKLSQPLLYEYDSAMDISVRIGDSEIRYDFEYQGSASHVLITPLTERAFFSITSAVCSGMDALCVGPEASGKNTTVRELCLVLGKPYFSFTCTNTTAYSILQDICKGLAAAGAWICLNGLERLPQCNLAFLAQLLGQIQSAKHYGKETVTLQLEEVPLNPAGACVATIKSDTYGNNSRDSYRNTNKLPSSLLNCFRIIGVSNIPVHFLLEAQLLLKGFSQVASLAQKLTTLLDSFAQLCTATVKGYGSAEKGKHPCLSISGLKYLLDEACIVLKSLQSNHVSKIGQDLLRIEDHQQSLEDRAVVIAINNSWIPQLSADQSAALKTLVSAEWPSVFSLNSTIDVRGTSDIDGLIPAVVASKYGCSQQVALSECTGETSIPNAIIKAIEKCHIFPSKTFVSKVSHLVQLALNYQTLAITGPPGCGKTKCIESYMETIREEQRITKDTVFVNALQPGHLLGFVDEESRWIDGSLARLLRTCHRQRTISKGNQVNILHLDGEIDDREMVLMKNLFCGAEPCLMFLQENKILHQVGNPRNTTLRTLVLSDTYVTETFCRICMALMQNVSEMMPEDIKKYFIFSTIWSFGGWLDTHERTHFSIWWHRTFKSYSTFPVDGQVWDYHIDTDTRQFVRWHDTLSCYFLSHGQSSASEAFVHTVHSEPLLYFSTLLTTVCCPVMLAGEAGCGKSLIVQEVLNSLCSGDVAEMLELRIPINNSTDPRKLWECLKDCLEWQHGTLHRPAGNKKLLCLLDDLNLAKMNDNGCQPACEFVRQLLDQERVFDPSSLKWKTIKDIIYLATWNAITAERLPKQRLRLLRHFCILYCQYPSRDHQHGIFSAILNTHFLPPATENKADSLAVPSTHHLPRLLSAITTVTIELQERLRVVFLKTSQRCHYIFTLRDLAKIFRNLCLSQDGSTTVDKLLTLWRHECDWVYGHRMSSYVDHGRYLLEYTTAAKKVFTNEEELQIILNAQQPMFSNIVEDDGGVITTIAKQQDMILLRKSDKTSPNVLDGYQESLNLSHMEKLLVEALQEYNKVNPRMNITFYKSAVELLCRLTRNLRSHRGSAHTMVCGEGCLRSSKLLARLAAHISGFSVVQLGSYNKEDKEERRAKRFKSQMADCYVTAGLKGQKTLLLLAEEEIDSTALVYMTEFVVFGSVSYLFTSEQQATIANAMRNEVTNAGLNYSKEKAWKLFLEAVQQNIRWLFIKSGVGPDFRKWCLDFSSLIGAINFYFIPQWSREYLVEHASHSIKELKMLTKEERENVCHLLTSMHLSVANHDKDPMGRHSNITNATFENFVGCFTVLANKQYDFIIKNHKLAKEVLDHVEEKIKSHAKLTDDLLHQKTVLEEHKEGTLKILIQIAQDKAVVEQKIHVIHQQLQKIKKYKALLPEYQFAHEKAQYKCSFILDNLKELVRHMDVRALGELRAMQKPDVDIEELMASVIIILKSPNTDLTWAKGAKRQMANIDRFLNELINFSNTKLPQSTLELLESNLKKAQFTSENMEKKSGGNLAASNLLKWLHGAVRYYRILTSKVKPLQSKVEEMTVALQEAEQKMTTLQQRKKAHILRLSDLERGFEEATIHKNKQQQRTVEIAHKFEQAANIAQLLEDERRKYASVVNCLPDRLSGIPGSTSLAAGLVSYLGAYEHHFRQLMLTTEWPKVLKEKGFPLMIDSIDPVKGRLIEFSVTFNSDSPVESQKKDLNNISKQRETIEDLFNDDDKQYPAQSETQLHEFYSHQHFLPIITEEFYGDFIKALLTTIVKKSEVQTWTAKDWTPQQMENAAILLFSWQRPALLIDPCFEGEKWVVEILEASFGKPFSSINLQARQESSVLAPVEKAISSGRPLILNNYGSKWDDLLMPLIDHCGATVEKDNHHNTSSILSFNGHRLLCSNEFKLFLAAAELEPLFNIEISSGTTMINYNYSECSLRELLLRRAFEKLHPDLHSQLMKTLSIILEHQQSLNEVEIRTRQCFTFSTLSDLYDTENITAIFQERSTVCDELDKAKITYATLLELRDKLYPLAHQGAMFYAMLKSLRVLAAEYYLSIEFFFSLFDNAIEGKVEPLQVEKVGFQTVSPVLVDCPDKKPGPQPQATATNVHEKEDNTSSNGQAFTSTHEVQTHHTQSSGQVRNLMDELTKAVYQILIQSLLPEHSIQACAMLFLITQQLDNENAFTEEEFAFFAQGGCSFDLTERGTHNSNLNPPLWMPSDIWSNLLTLSVISDPLSQLCMQITENSLIWENWYNTDCQGDGNRGSIHDVGKGSIAYLPECGDAKLRLTDFQELLLLRAVCPDRFPDAVSRYVTKLSSDLVFENLLPGIEELARLDENLFGVLILLPPAKSNISSYSGAVMSHKPLIVISKAAKEKDIPLFHVSVKKSCEEEEVKTVLSDAMNQNGWLVIENLHLASKPFLKNLHRSLTYAAKMQASQKAERQFCVWLISEPGASIPQTLIAQLKKVSWHYLVLNQKTRDVSTKDVTYIDSLPQLLSSAILSALEWLKEGICEKMKGSPAIVHDISFGVCIIHGILQAQKVYPLAGLSNMMDISHVQLNEALETVLSAYEKMKAPSDFAAAVEEGVSFVYINLTLRPEDAAYVQALVHEIVSCILQRKEIILDKLTIPIPPSNMEPSQYFDWMTDCIHGQSFLLPMSIEKAVIEKASSEFMQVMATLHDAMEMSLPLLKQGQNYSGKNLTLLHTSLERISEQLPSLIQIDTNNASLRTNFYNHSVETELQASKHILLQECKLMNTSLRYIRYGISRLLKCLLNGLTSTTPLLIEAADALQRQAVPKSWVYSPNICMGSQSIANWLDELHKRHKQLTQWIKEGLMPFDKGEKGALKSVNLGYLFNPKALVLALRLDFAVHHKYSLHEVVLQCHIAEYPDYKPDTEGYPLYIENLILLGAAWDFKNNHLTESRETMHSLPFVIITPTHTGNAKHNDDSTEIYDCPVCTDCSMQYRLMTLPLQCTKPAKKWHLKRVAIILNPQLNMKNHGMSRVPPIKEQSTIPLMNTRAKKDKLSHAKIFQSASKMKYPDGLQNKEGKTLECKVVQGISSPPSSDDNLRKDKATVLLQNIENEMIAETKDTVLSPLFINDAISNQEDTEFFRGAQSSIHQNTTPSDDGDSVEIKAESIERDVLLKSESEDAADKAEDVIIRVDLIADTRSSDYETSYNEHSHGFNNSDLEKAAKGGYEDDFDKEIKNDFEDSLHSANDCEPGENQESYKSRWKMEDNNGQGFDYNEGDLHVGDDDIEHEFDNNEDGILVGDDLHTIRDISAKAQEDEEE